ncbi:MAG TPA: four helix bundle protein [Candidatus Paceibacterota bacterium]
MARDERFGIGGRIDALLLDLLETLRKASFANATSKLSLLGSALSTEDSLRFFLQIAWESKLIPNKHYEELAAAVEEIGRMTGGWRKGLLAKTPPKKGGERNE